MPALPDYHGRNVETETAQETPPRSKGWAVGLGENCPQINGGFAMVRFTGRYGLLCANFQSFERDNITQDEAHQIAWDSFGLCSKSISYFDSNGGLLFTEN